MNYFGSKDAGLESTAAHHQAQSGRGSRMQRCRHLEERCQHLEEQRGSRTLGTGKGGQQLSGFPEMHDLSKLGVLDKIRNFIRGGQR